MSIARSRYLFFVEKAVALRLLAFAILITCQTDDLFSDHACHLLRRNG